MNELIEIIAKRFAVRHGHETPCEGCQHEAKDAINALEEAGFRIVPVEPNDHMINQGFVAASKHIKRTEDGGIDFYGSGAIACYKAMLEASPHAAKG